MKNILSLCVALCVASLLVADAARAAKKEAEPVPEATLDQFTFGESLNGVAFESSSLKDSPAVVEFWGAHCGPCIASLPIMEKLYKRGSSKGLKVVGIHCQQAEDAEILKLLKDAKVDYPILRSGKSPIAFSGIPRVFVFNPQGKLAWTGNPHDPGFEKAVRDVMR